MPRNFLVVDPEEKPEVLRALASDVRVRILKLLHLAGPLNINDIAGRLEEPQSTISSHVQILTDAGLVRTESQKAKKGNQKICHSLFDEVLLMFKEDIRPLKANAIEVAMPIGLYTSCQVSAPCGLCSADGIIGLLDVPDTFLDPDRMKAGLMWFTRGFVEYQFPNNARLSHHRITSMEFSMELSSEVPGTSADWPSDITVSVNGKDIGTWMSPGDFGDKRGVYTPDWWKLKGSQYGKLKGFAGERHRHLRRRRQDFTRLAERPGSGRPPIDTVAYRGQGRREAPGWHQHFRAGLRQLRPGHRPAACETD